VRGPPRITSSLSGSKTAPAAAGPGDDCMNTTKTTKTTAGVASGARPTDAAADSGVDGNSAQGLSTLPMAA
jgi:hypothetical protein